MTKIRIIPLVGLIGLFSVFLSGCKKSNKENVHDEPISANLQNRIDKAIAWMKTQPKMVMHPIHEKLRNFQVDENGNEVSFRSLRTTGSGTGCAPISDPSAFIDNWALTDADCNHDNYYQVVGEFSISSENAVVSTNPNNSSQHTYGRILVRNSSNVLCIRRRIFL